MTDKDRTILDPARGDEPSAEFVDALWMRLDAAWPTHADTNNTDPSSTPIEVAVFNDKETQMDSRRKMVLWAGAAAAAVVVILGAAVFTSDNGQDSDVCAGCPDDPEVAAVAQSNTQSTPSPMPTENDTTDALSKVCATQDPVNEDLAALDALDPATDSAEDYFDALDNLSESARALLSASSDLISQDIENINNANSDLQDSVADASYTLDGVSQITLAEAGTALVASVETQIAELQAFYAEAYAGSSCN